MKLFWGGVVGFGRNQTERIRLEDVKRATKNFCDESIIGRGSHGTVYKGELLQPKGSTVVAFKRLRATYLAADSDGSEFLMEYKHLSTHKHENIVPLVGFCDESGEKILVYEFLSRGSLDRYLSDADLTWSIRLQICLGAARGLSYVHNPQGTEHGSGLHCDINSTNILLDKNWHAKICDLGVSNPLVHIQQHVLEEILVPKCFHTSILSKESDIYSFGVVLLELLCGRMAVTDDDEEERKYLVPWARSHYKKRTITEIIDPILRKQMNPDSLRGFSALAYQCLKLDRTKRPTILQIVKKLEQVLRLQKEFEEALALQQVADNLISKQEDEDDSYKVKNMEHMKIPLEDIKFATHNFDDAFAIGRGGFGKVYRADLFHFDVKKYVKEHKFQNVPMAELSGYPRRQSTVAIKRLDSRFGQGSAEFLQEISMLPYFRHKNLVTLVGFCDEDHERILVYEYASNGSLDKHICSTDTTYGHTWATRLQICLDAASGLEFLHNGVGEHHRIIHRDIKSSNILLGRNYIGMISDFGLSRIGPANLQATFIMTQVAGTVEYIDPQYHKTGKLTKESDVYSFGVVLFEALSGRLAHFQRSKDDPEFLPRMAKRCFEQKMVSQIINKKFKKEFEKAGSSIVDDENCPDSINLFASIAYRCCQEKLEDRPTMVDVVKELTKAFNSHVKGVEALRTSLDDVIFATNNFQDMKEQGPLGEVYCGELYHVKGHNTVTIKRLHPTVDSHGEKFLKDIARLYGYSHENVVQVLGFCDEGTERIIVLEHMVNGSLKEHLKNTNLTWKQRLKICVDAAFGLAYIHSHVKPEPLIHGDIKSSSILLKHDWKAAISDIVIFKGEGTLGYLDPLYVTRGLRTQKSDVYSFGVVLFEILSGRLAIERIKNDPQHPRHEVPNVEPQNSAGGKVEEEQVIFLSKLVENCFRNKKLDEIIFHDIKKQIEPKSLVIFSKIAYQCLMEQPEDRPTMAKVVEELTKAFKCQDEWEWEKKLPSDYLEIIEMSKCLVLSTITKKDIHSLLSSGVLLHNQVWLSINMDGVKNELVSAKKFSYKKRSSMKWRSAQKSRFPKVAKIFDVSNLDILVQIRTQFLTPKWMYGAYLVFKFCDRRKVSSRPIYVNLKYKMAGETFSSYFAEWKDGSTWLTVELLRFSSDNRSTNFEVLLESFSQYYCGRWGVLIEGIEFKPIHGVDFKENKELSDEKNNTGELLKTNLGVDWGEQMMIDYIEIIKRSKNTVQNVSKEELYLLLYEGILIDEDEKLFSLSKVSGKKCLVLPAKAVLCTSSNVKSCKLPTGSRCRFAEVIEILSHQDFCIKCDIETRMLSSHTTYACFLLFQLSPKCCGLKCPVKARDLLPNKKERTKIISFTSPTIVNLEKIKWIPKQREDGWMEVGVWETIVDNKHKDGYVPMDLKLITFEGTMSGLIVYGIEFRPI